MTNSKVNSAACVISNASFVSMGVDPTNKATQQIVVDAANKLAHHTETALNTVSDFKLDLGQQGFATQGGLQGQLAGTARNAVKELA